MPAALPPWARAAGAAVALSSAACEAEVPSCHLGGTPFQASSAAALCFGAGEPLFEDATPRAGVGHIHQVPEGYGYYHANVGGGAVLEDLDGDGDLDLYVTNGDGPKAFYRNRGDGTFDECAERAGLSFPEDWTLGVSAADYDNDGDQDIYLLNHGPNRLLRNRGDATFEDVTEAAQVGDPGTGASASWGDVDGDGYLDLFVGNLAEDFHPARGATPTRSRLYRSRGDGTFEDASTSFGPAGLPEGSSYAGLLFDLDQDGFSDLLLTEEFGPGNRLFRGGGRPGAPAWEDISEAAGVSLPAAVMGVALLDLEDDGLPDLFLTNLWGEPPGREALLQNLGGGRFADVSAERGAFAMEGVVDPGVATRTVSWAAVTLDIENDADEDLYVVYGQFLPTEDLPLNGSSYPPMRPGQENALLRDDGGAFTLLEGTCAEEAGRGRGAVAGDVNGDGCVDLYVVNQDGAARLLRNRCDDAGRSLELELVGTRSNRDGIGARITVIAGGVTQERFVASGTGVHSSGPKRVHVGLGPATEADEVRVRWPSGAMQMLRSLAAGRRHTVVEP